MWLFTVDGYFSAVQVRDNPERIMVRARVREDLERLVVKLPEVAGMSAREIVFTPSADYAFRLFIDRSHWAAYVASAAWQIDYTNFKARAAVGAGRSRAYHACWAVLSRWQCEEQIQAAEDDLQPDLFDVDEDLLAEDLEEDLW